MANAKREPTAPRRKRTKVRKPKAPVSYLNCRRPSLTEALGLEDNGPGRETISIRERMERLEAKGYFTPKPRPWRVMFEDLGMGRRTFIVVDRFGDVICEHVSQEDASFIVSAVNAVRG